MLNGMQFLKSGEKVNTTLGKAVVLDGPFPGGQGVGYKAKLGARTVFLKLFFDRAVPSLSLADTRKRIDARIRAVVGRDISKLVPQVVAPFAIVTETGMAGHVAPYLSGFKTLEAYLATPADYATNVEIAASLACIVAALHAHGLCHGDLHHENIALVGGNVYLLDIDNAHWAGCPPPIMAGREEVMAPELRAGRGGQINLATDVNSLAKILLELLLNRVFSAGLDNIVEVNAREDAWSIPGDPLRGCAEVSDGFPFAALTTNMQAWLRAALSPDPAQRPTAAAFGELLRRETVFKEGPTMHAAWTCGHCGCPFFYFAGRTHCPKCNTRIRHVRLVTSRGELELNGNRQVGRNDPVFGGYPAISGIHLGFMPVSPFTCRCSVLGVNGVDFWDHATGHHRHHRVGDEFVLHAQDRLRIAGLEAELCA